MNQGRIAGAGIAEHLHQHVVPRWALDSNFFPIIARHEGAAAPARRGARRDRRGLARLTDRAESAGRGRPMRRCAASIAAPCAPVAPTIRIDTHDRQLPSPRPPRPRSSAPNRVKRGLAEMLKGGVIMDVVTAEQAQHRRRRRRRRRHGARARSRRHPRPGRRRPHERPRPHRGDHRRGLDPGDGEGPHRPLRRGAGAAGARRRLHRRVRGALAGRLREPHRQVGLHRPVRLRCDQPRRGASPHHRGRRDDPLEGRGRHGRRLRGDQAHPHDHLRDQRTQVDDQGRALRRREGAAGARTTSSPRSPRPASSRSCCSPRAASRLPPTLRS